MYLSKSSSGKEIKIEVKDQQIIVDGEVLNGSIINTSENRYQVIHNNKVYRIEVISTENKGKSTTLKVNQQKFNIELHDSLDQVMKKMGISANSNSIDKDIKAPMPGMILDIMAKEGEEVKKGDALLVLEAMKMENILKAPAEVKIKKIQVNQGESVEKKQVLIEFE